MDRFIIHYRDGTNDEATSLVGTNYINGPGGAKGWHAEIEGKGHTFIPQENVLLIRDRRYPIGFDAVWDARREAP